MTGRGTRTKTDQLAAAITALEGAEAPLLHTLARRLGRLDALIEAGAPVARLRAREIADLMWRREVEIREAGQGIEVRRVEPVRPG